MKLMLAAIFSNHMVMQRNGPVPIWGWAAPGMQVQVTFESESGRNATNVSQHHTTQADAFGVWRVRLDPLHACNTSARLLVSSTVGELITIDDILVGDVWFCSGQSNMQMTVAGCFDTAIEFANTHLPQLRFFTVPTVVQIIPPRDITATWCVSTLETTRRFSAVGYFFGRKLLHDENIPIGLINCSWGGTRVETWISHDSLQANDLCRCELEAYQHQLSLMNSEPARQSRELFASDSNAWIKLHAVPDPGNTGYDKGWADCNFDDTAWPEMVVPGSWQSNGVPGNGVLWFRRSIDIPSSWVGQDLLLSLGCCDKHDITWFNNEQVGSTSWETPEPWSVPRVYRVPGRLVRAGRNMIATRIYSYRNAGGLSGPAKVMELRRADTADNTTLPLEGRWLYRIEHDFGVTRIDENTLLPNQNSPHALFDNMVMPIAPFALRGFIWYQGESNASEPHLYRTRFSMLIRDWRRLWQRPDLPFLFVQLAGYKASGTWPLLREAQAQVLSEPYTGMATAIDIGDAIDIHPRNKQEVGRRLALIAESIVYGRHVVYHGPLFKEMQIEENRLRLTFHTGNSSLMAHTIFDPTGAPLKNEPSTAINANVHGFMIAGADKRFVKAYGRIENETVIVWNDRVTHPVAVRYAWNDCPDGNLYNCENLPAPPFRTDKWQV